MTEHDTTAPKTLRDYRKEQETQRRTIRGADLEDWLILANQEIHCPEQSLWRAVILQMVTDAISNSNKADNKRFKRDARHWLTSHSRDFRKVCEHAGYDAAWLQEQINQFLAQHAEQSPPKPAPTQSHFAVKYQFNGSIQPIENKVNSYDFH
jgi:hypothetical protein